MIACPLCGTGLEHRHSSGSMQCGCGGFNCRAEGAYYTVVVGHITLSFYPGQNNPVYLGTARWSNRLVLPEGLPDIVQNMVAAAVIDS